MKSYFVPATYESMANKKQKLRGFNSLNQMEMMYLVSAAEVDMHEVKHKVYEGTNYGNCIGPVIFQANDVSWALSWKEKRELYGSHRHAQGGPKPGGPEGKENHRTDKTIEPVFFNSMPLAFWEELYHSHFIKEAVHLTIGDGAAAIAAIEHGIKIVAVCLSEKHAELLHQRLVDNVFARMSSQSSNLYQKALKELTVASIIGELDAHKRMRRTYRTKLFHLMHKRAASQWPAPLSAHRRRRSTLQVRRRERRSRPRRRSPWGRNASSTRRKNHRTAARTVLVGSWAQGYWGGQGCGKGGRGRGNRTWHAAGVFVRAQAPEEEREGRRQERQQIEQTEESQEGADLILEQRFLKELR